MFLQCKIMFISAFLACTLLLSSCTNLSQTVSAEYDFRHHYYARAFAKLWWPAHNGNTRAMYALGYMYYYGLGTARDQDLARIWFKRSAKLEYAPSVKAYQLITNPRVEQYVPFQENGARPIYRYKRFYAPVDRSRKTL